MKRLLALVASAMLTGCSFGLEKLPAPAGTHGPTYHVTARFGDVANLTLGAKVKLGGVVVGEVTSITTANYRASVGMTIERAFRLGTDARFQIRFTTPLGEQFVSITARGSLAHGALTDGAMVPLRDTSNAPGIEDTFAALSTLLNGGGLGKLQIIASELDAAFKGRTGDAQDVLVKLHTVIANLDAHRADIDGALDGLARLAQILRRGTPLVGQALELFPDTLHTLADDTTHVRGLLDRVAALGNTVDGLLRRSQRALLADFDNLRPTLDALRARQAELLPTFRSLIKLGHAVRRAAPGDYLNLSATIQFLLEAPAARPQPGGIIHRGAEPQTAVRELLISGSGPG
ncbi:MAG TPA: MCE family protein [Jatrophihabitans sp.]|jgi:phospholipid/cholesterol/gamma-HCH transport system substrate-binding protein|nr:MCE family protein [Jatrophihabitans sp.]